MSVTFYPATVDGGPLLRCACEVSEATPCVACLASLNVNNRNACDLLCYLGLGDMPASAMSYGSIDAIVLADLCRLRLAMAEAEAAIQPTQTGRLVSMGRSAGYLRARCRELLVVATLARGSRVAWS